MRRTKQIPSGTWNQKEEDDLEGVTDPEALDDPEVVDNPEAVADPGTVGGHALSLNSQADRLHSANETQTQTARRYRFPRTASALRQKQSAAHRQRPSAGNNHRCDFPHTSAFTRPDVKAKSKQQRKNRMSEVAGLGTGCSRHTGGSRSTFEHYHKLRDELQKEPNLFECFEHMHKKKNGAFVDERSKKIAEEIQARHDAATQEVEGSTEPPVINMSQLYVDVVGGVKKQRIYGLGTKASTFINDNNCSSSTTSQFHQDTMKEMLDTMRVEMEAQMEAKLQAERTQMQAQMQVQIQAQIASLMDELRRNGIIPTTSTPQPPTTEGHSVNSNDEDLGDD
nr:uncharacterized protein LOC109146588 [Ipomoea batatas]